MPEPWFMEPMPEPEVVVPDPGYVEPGVEPVVLPDPVVVPDVEPEPVEVVPVVPVAFGSMREFVEPPPLVEPLDD